LFNVLFIFKPKKYFMKYFKEGEEGEGDKKNDPSNFLKYSHSKFCLNYRLALNFDNWNYNFFFYK